MRELIAASVLAVVAAGAGVAGYVVHGETAARSCTIASGQAATTLRCDDGRLVKIAGPAPRCPTEDSCTVDYRGGAWHITRITP